MANNTRFKLGEAEYFLAEMEAKFEDETAFRYCLSAFLTAMRSIAEIMREQYDEKEGFREWFCPRFCNLKMDKEIAFLNKKRNFNVHRKQVPVKIEAASRMGHGIMLVKAGDEPPICTPPASGETKMPSNPLRISYQFPEFDNADVLSLCRNNLAKLELLVEECENKFLKTGSSS